MQSGRYDLTPVEKDEGSDAEANQFRIGKQ